MDIHVDQATIDWIPNHQDGPDFLIFTITVSQPWRTFTSRTTMAGTLNECDTIGNALINGDFRVRWYYRIDLWKFIVGDGTIEIPFI